MLFVVCKNYMFSLNYFLHYCIKTSTIFHSSCKKSKFIVLCTDAGLLKVQIRRVSGLASGISMHE